MRVEITEDSLSDINPDDNHHYRQVKGDILTVPAHLGQYWVDLGWAKDVDGVHPTGERIPGAHPHIQHLYRRAHKNFGSPPDHIKHIVHAPDQAIAEPGTLAPKNVTITGGR